MLSIRTDLAMEAREIYREQALDKENEISGVLCETENEENFTVTRVKINSAEGEKALGKPKGTYITIEAPSLLSHDEKIEEEVCQRLSLELSNIAGNTKDSTTLVVGLGNFNITPDAIGPKAISSLMITRHLLEHIPEYVDNAINPVCAIAPGVLGQTGMETGEIVRGVVDRIKPDRVIVIDALASRKMQRVSTTIQLSDTGICPGSGVGNKRKALNRETLGVPVIAIGIPTVVDAATIASDTIDLVAGAFLAEAEKGSSLYSMLKDMDKEEKYHLIREVLSPYVGDLMVTPKDIDRITETLSKIIANGINLCMHKGLSLEQVGQYV